MFLGYKSNIDVQQVGAPLQLVPELPGSPAVRWSGVFVVDGQRTLVAMAAMGTGPPVGGTLQRATGVNMRWNPASRVSPRVCVLRASILSPAWNSPTPPKFSLSLSLPAQKYLNSPSSQTQPYFFFPSSETNNRKRRDSRAHAFLQSLRLVRNDSSLQSWQEPLHCVFMYLPAASCFS